MTGIRLHLLLQSAFTFLLSLAVVQVQANDRTVLLFSDDFSRYPAGPLSCPIDEVNPAVQEYHYFAHRGMPLEPWGNAICYLDAWSGDRLDGRPALKQVLSSSDTRMMPRLFSPLFITGDPAWTEYTVEANVQPLSTGGVSGIVLNYHTNRHHLVFCLQNGDEARMAVRLPLEKSFRVVDWTELGTVNFPYEAGRTYRLKVESRQGNLTASIDGKVLVEAPCSDRIAGKAGLVANVPTRFFDFSVKVSPTTHREIQRQIRERESALVKLRSQNPQPVLWRSFETPKFGAGRNVRFGDLNGDGELDMLIGQNMRMTETNSATELSCLTAVTLQGKVLWQRGTPSDELNAQVITCDTPFQIHDLDQDGICEVVLAQDRKLQILDGATGKQKYAVDVPLVTSYPQVPQKVRADWPTNLSSGDSLIFADFSGTGHRDHVILKDRYWNFWVFDRQLKQLWSGQGMLGHYPYVFPDPSTGRDALAIGFALWDHSGKLKWTLDHELKDHADNIAVGNFSDDPANPPRFYYCGSDEGILVVDARGFIDQQIRVGHAQTSTIGKFREDLPGLQLVAMNFWKNPGIISVIQHDGTLLQQEEPCHSGSPMLPVNWRGDGTEFILLSGNGHEGGLLNGHLQRVVMFPDDGHPDLCAAAMNVTGDPRDEILLWDQNRVWIYTQGEPFSGNRIYAPRRNPPENDSNYRCNVSWPAWQSMSTNVPE